ncbi:MAG TPA: cytochrome P450 [Burkholderiales bacterium]|nr:cytochrome P450 [Burkholderiales bacterium]
MDQTIVRPAPLRLPRYDPHVIAPAGLLSKIDVKWVHLGLRIARWLWFLPRLGGLTIVSRYDDVAEVLNRPDVFKVPFDEEIPLLNDGERPGTNFILGIDNVKAHDEQLRFLMAAFRRSDIADVVVPRARAIAEANLARQPLQFDAIGELITRVPLELCTQYYGVPIPGDLRTFAYATIDLSGHLFGPPPVNGTASAQVFSAARYVRVVLDAAIAARTASETTPLGRLLSLQTKAPQQLSDKHIRAFLTGMIVGFVPTNTLAGGHILEMLLDHPSYLKQAQSAALVGDDDLLWRVLLEALRFKPHNFGPFRICERDYVLAADTFYAARIKAGGRVLASTMSAMFDARHVDAPRRFIPGRPASDYMMFGHGIHWCVGAYIAQAQLTQTFKALLRKGRLERVAGESGKTRRRGFFPDRLNVMLTR